MTFRVCFLSRPKVHRRSQQFGPLTFELSPFRRKLHKNRLKRKQLEFACPGINIIEIPINRFTENEKLFPSDLFSENFNYFWRGLKLPKGPNTQPILEFNSLLKNFEQLSNSIFKGLSSGGTHLRAGVINAFLSFNPSLI